MGSKFLVVAGNGETTRVNVEALLEDHYRGNGKKDVVLLLPFQDRPSQGQVWAHQVSNELGILTTAIAPENSIIMSLGSASLHTAKDPVSVVAEMIKGENAEAFILWDQEDGFGVSLFSTLVGASVPCYDLCMGLVELSHVETSVAPQEVVTAEIPKIETEPDITKNLTALPVIVSEDLAKAIGKAVAKAVTEVLEKYGISG